MTDIHNSPLPTPGGGEMSNWDSVSVVAEPSDEDVLRVTAHALGYL